MNKFLTLALVVAAGTSACHKARDSDPQATADNAVASNTVVAAQAATTNVVTPMPMAAAKPAADNTARNARDQVTAPTADNAGSSPADIEMMQKIRSAIIDDQSLSVNAHNCKIVAQNGVVTLIGPVADQDERTKVEKIAAAIVDDRNVVNKLEVTK